jgi:hypothetical protein
MVRLLERLWSSRNRGVDTPRSPSWLGAGLRGVTPPAQRSLAPAVVPAATGAA